MRKQTLVRFAVFAATTVAAWGILAWSPSDEDPVELNPGDVAQRDYQVVDPGPVTDSVAFEQAQQAAREEIEPETEPREGVESQVLENIEGFFADLRDSVVRPVSSTSTTAPTTTTSTTTSTTVPDDTSDTSDTTTATTPSTTLPPETVEVSGVLFVDADGDGAFNPEPAAEGTEGEDGEGDEDAIVDVPLPMIGVIVESEDGSMSRAESQSDGTWTTTASEGEITVTVDQSDPEFPGFPDSTDTVTQTIECFDACDVEPVGFAPELVPVEEVLASFSTVVPDEAVATLARIAREDVIRVAVGGENRLAAVQRVTVGLAEELFNRQIFETPTDEGLALENARLIAAQQPPIVFYDSGRSDAEAGAAAGQVVANFLRANWEIDEEATAAAREAAAAEVTESDYQQVYQEDQIIARAGDELTQSEIDAIRATTGLFDRTQRQSGLLAVLAILSSVLALYLNRFRPEFWAKPRMVALLGILIVFGAAAVRGTMFLEPQVGLYVIPAVAFGLMATVLFDARIGVLMALAMAILTAAGTRDSGITVYALLATMAPIGFVSSVSSRRAFRNAAVYSALGAAVTAAATSWFFHTGPQDPTPAQTVGLSTAWAFAVSLVAALLGLALLQFFESAFDLTTTLTLLDLTDRNHEALQLLQERAFGTFNHSLMVGTLADAAARAIGANPLLARAAAYYHDLGKTENPTMFIENQFGTANPHDELTPVESAEVIRRHVTDGIRLAKRFKIPAEVAEGIVSHHGDAIMRYFYEKARSEDPDVDPGLFRHVGHKPQTSETAIVMLADSLEASCRAVFQSKEPSPQAIEELVSRVIDEKVDDGQLAESPLTLAQLTDTRKAFVGSLVGHYHQRITYPNFPGS